MSDVEWRDIPSAPGYAASSNGEIRRNVGTHSKKFGKAMVVRANNAGYLYVNISIGGVIKSRYVHHLVAEAFHGPRPEDFIVGHGDDNKLNNRKDNLSYITPRENNLRAVAAGLLRPRRGEAHAYAKLTDDDVRQIRARVEAGEPQAALAREFNVASSAIWQIISGRSWRHVA
jgi:hypothetical protein